MAMALDRYDKLFTPRQLTALTTFSDLVAEARERVLTDAKTASMPDDGQALADGGMGAEAYADAVATYLAIVVNKVSRSKCVNCRMGKHREHRTEPICSTSYPNGLGFCESNVFFESPLGIFMV